MSAPFLKLIQTGSTAEVADAVQADPALAAWRDPQGVSALIWSVFSRRTAVTSTPDPAEKKPAVRTLPGPYSVPQPALTPPQPNN